MPWNDRRRLQRIVGALFLCQRHLCGLRLNAELRNHLLKGAAACLDIGMANLGLHHDSKWYSSSFGQDPHGLRVVPKRFDERRMFSSISKGQCPREGDTSTIVEDLRGEQGTSVSSYTLGRQYGKGQGSRDLGARC